MKKLHLTTFVIPLILFACSNSDSTNEEETSTSTTTTSAEMVSSESESESEEVIEEELDFNTWLAEQNHPNENLILENLDDLSIEEIVDTIATNTSVSFDNISIVYHDLTNDTYYNLNEELEVIAASTTKVFRTMVIQDAIEAGDMTSSDAVPYSSSFYQNGGGKITEDANNGVVASTYPLESVIYETLYDSDNTANTMLKFYYDSIYGTGAMYQQMVELSDGLWTLEDAQDNNITASVYESIFNKLFTDETYQPLVEIMKTSEEDMFTKAYIEGTMATKYGALYEYLHHVGAYYIDDIPVYDLVIYTNGLGNELATEFMGQLNLQLATLTQFNAAK